MDPREIDVPVAGGAMVAHVWGEGDQDIILVPSIGGSESYWWHTARRLGERARVVTYTLRGHGRSRCEVDGSGDMLSDVVRLADHLDMPRPAIVGKEFGGSIAALCAALFPDRFAALGLLDSPMILPQEEYAAVIELFEDPACMDTVVHRLGLGYSGEGEDAFQEFVNRYAVRLVDDGMARAASVGQARTALVTDTLVHSRGDWQRRPTGGTCRRLVALSQRVPARLGCELLDTVSVPVWVLQPVEGHFADALPGFRGFARGRGWHLVELAGGTDVLFDDGPARALEQLLNGLTVQGRLAG